MTDQRTGKLSIVAPIFNEERLAAELCRRLGAAAEATGLDYELVLVNDGSRDATLNRLIEESAKNPRIRIINLSRNFGHQIAITAGVDRAAGDAIVVIDGDLQDPPEAIGPLVDKWREGFDVVYGIRKKRPGETAFKLWTAKLFYRLMARLSDMDLPVDAGDFRLMDRKAADALRSMHEGNRYIRGMVTWVGFRQCGVMYERAPRTAGETKYTLGQMFQLAFNGVTSFSERPLQLASYAGMMLTFFSFLLIVYLLYSKLFHPETVIQGWTSQTIIIVFIGGVQLLSIGIMGEYIGRIYREVKRRPLYFVEGEYASRK